MPRIQSFLPALRPLSAPRAVHAQTFRFSTASQRWAEQPIKATPQAPAAPSTPQSASRAADLAAAEAVTESDSAQPAPPKPTLPSDHAPPSSSSASALSSSTANTFPKARTPPTSRTTPSPQIPLAPARYLVSRSSGKNIPVYTDRKRGGNLKLTTVRKVSGDLTALRDELRVFLNKKNEDVRINPLTNHVIVKGHHAPEVMEYLRGRGM